MIVKKNMFYMRFAIVITILAFIFKVESFALLMIVASSILLVIVAQKRPEWIVILLILFATRYLNTAPTHVMGIQFAKLEILVLLATFFLWITQKFAGINRIPEFYKILLGTIIIIISAAIMAKLKINQSIFLGIQIQLRLIIILLIYPVVAMMKRSKDSYHRLWCELKRLAVIYGFMLMIQYLLHGKIAFMVYDSEYERLGGLRISYGYMLLVLGVFLILSELNERIEIKNVLFVAIFAFDLLAVAQGRMAMLGTFGGVFVAYILTNRASSVKSWKNALYAGILLLISVLAAWQNIQGLINLTEEEVGGQTGNYIARVDEITFYTNQVDNIILGRGYISPKTTAGANLDSKYDFYSIQDIGLYGLYVTNGVVGLLWYLSIFLVLIIETRKKKSRFLFIAYIVYTMIVCMTLLNFYYSSEYLIAVMALLACAENRNNIKKGKVNK